MAYTFQGINTMSSALRAYRTQLDTTGDNIANAETVGFHRRSVTLTQAPSTTDTLGHTVTVGGGVSVVAVSRVRDLFLAGRRAEAESKLGRGQQSLTGLKEVQSAMMEPGDDGVSAAYDAFNSAWSALSASPGSAGARADVQTAGARLASKVNGFSADLRSLRADNATDTKDALAKVDAATAKIARLNTDIATAVARGGTPNDLLDERDRTVLELSGLADVTVSKGDGNVSVSLNGLELVSPSGAKTISDKYDIASGTVVDGASTFVVRGGALAGAHDARATIDATAAKLDAFAENLRTSVNALFKAGTTAGGATDGAFFAEPVPPATALGADGLRLSDAVAADPNAIASGTSGLAGDGLLAAQISALRDEKLTSLGGQTLSGYYAGLVSDVGRAVATAKDGVDVQETVVKQIDAQISGTEGVSMDDEMANLLRFQRSYQAAAKALSTFDSVTETLIGMLNR